MRHFSITWLTALTLAVTATQAGAQPAPAAPAASPAPFHARRLEGKPSPPARIDAVAWLAGRWVGEGLGGFNEETWNPPRGGVMTGMYRLLKGDKPVFYEFLLLMEDKGSLVLKLKHFNPDFSAWEEKEKTVDFALVAVEPGAVHFDGLSFIRQDDGSLRIYLLLKDKKTGTVREEEFKLRREPAAG